MIDGFDIPISADWLKEVGFKWHQLERQPDKHWLLWIDNQDHNFGCDDLGLELAPSHDGTFWFCWFRYDGDSGRYHRFIHVRYLRVRADVVQMVEAISGQAWNTRHHLHGRLLTPERAERRHADNDRLDRVILRSNPKWNDSEDDDSRGRALPEHRQAYEKTRDR